MRKEKGRKKKEKSNVFLVVGILLIAGIITIGYATLQTVLNINGTANIGGATWNIYFSEVQSTAASNVTPTTVPTVTGTDTVELTYAVNLAKPGDKYQFKAKITNAGSIDAKLDSVTLTGADSYDYINYTVTYANGSEILADDTLNAGTFREVLVTVEFDKEDTEVGDLPSSATALSLRCAFDYVQA